MLTLIPPQTLGEWLAWTSALITIVFGLICFFAPRTTYRILRLRTAEGVPEALSESRATMAGFYLGTGVLAILFQQPFIWMVLGAGWAFTALGRLVSIFADRGNTSFNWGSLVFEFALAAAPLAFALGYVR